MSAAVFDSRHRSIVSIPAVEHNACKTHYNHRIIYKRIILCSLYCFFFLCSFELFNEDPGVWSEILVSVATKPEPKQRINYQPRVFYTWTP